MTKSIWTIGHSNHDSDRFLELLKKHRISAIADVRSSPYSQYTDQFNREILQHTLRSKNIAYVFLGHELGAQRGSLDCYRNDQVCFDRVAATELFQRGLERLRRGADKYRLAIMCTEKDPITCHRMILVARQVSLHHSDMVIRHIRETGESESHENAETRLLESLNLPIDGGLFQSRCDLLSIAYEKQGKEIAYTLTPEEKEKIIHAQSH